MGTVRDLELVLRTKSITDDLFVIAGDMLFQVNDPEDCFASKIVPLGKYYDLKTP